MTLQIDWSGPDFETSQTLEKKHVRESLSAMIGLGVTIHNWVESSSMRGYVQ